MQLAGLSAKTAFLFCIGASLGFVSLLVYYAMIGRVNRFLPDEQQIPYWTPSMRGQLDKPFRLFREHRRIYPRSALPQIGLGLYLAALVLVGVAIFSVKI